MLTSSAVVLEEHINTSSELGRDGEVSCMYKDSTVPRMSSAMGMSNNNNKLRLKSTSMGWGLKLRMYWKYRHGSTNKAGIFFEQERTIIKGRNAGGQKGKGKKLQDENLKGSEKINQLVMGPRMFLPFGITARFGFPRFKYFG